MIYVEIMLGIIFNSFVKLFLCSGAW